LSQPEALARECEPGAEELDIVVEVDQRIAEQRHDELDAAVPGGGTGIGDGHRCRLVKALPEGSS
jgi:hypothetical protein